MKRNGLLLIFFCALCLVACAPAGSEPAAVHSQTGATLIDLQAVPTVDTSIHSVPLAEIYFDTFQSVDRAVPLSEADDSLIQRLRDAIPPIYNPVFETLNEADKWLRDSDLVLGYADGDEAYAYPVKILNYHEIVSHEVNGRSVMATYCPLCASGVMYDRTVDGDVLLFGNTSALYESDMVMLDHQTGSYWVQVSGKAVVGPMTDTRLTVLPSQTTTWGIWKAEHPHTLSLSQNTGHERNYERDPFVGYAEQLSLSGQFAFPVSEAVEDARLAAGASVLGVHVGEQTHVYPVETIGDGVVNDTLGETAVVVFVTQRTGAAYDAMLGGQTLTFSWTRDGFLDDQTGSRWNMAGTAVSGELAGAQLQPLPSRTTLWFAMIAAFPNLMLVTK